MVNDGWALLPKQGEEGPPATVARLAHLAEQLLQLGTALLTGLTDGEGQSWDGGLRQGNMKGVQMSELLQPGVRPGTGARGRVVL